MRHVHNASNLLFIQQILSTYNVQNLIAKQRQSDMPLGPNLFPGGIGEKCISIATVETRNLSMF